MREGLAWTLALALGGALAYENIHHRSEEQETLGMLTDCAGGLLEHERTNDDLRQILADVYFDKGDEILDCEQAICESNGWIRPIDWYEQTFLEEEG